MALKSLNDPIDSTSSQGRLIFNIFASLAESERVLIRQRTQADLHAARNRGRLGGRPKGLSDEAKRKAVTAEAIYQEGKLSVREIARQLRISESTPYSFLRHQGFAIGSSEAQSLSEGLPDRLNDSLYLRACRLGTWPGCNQASAGYCRRTSRPVAT